MSAQAYNTKPGSIPHKVLSHLVGNADAVMGAEFMESAFGVKPHSRYPILKLAVEAGYLQKVEVDDELHYARGPTFANWALREAERLRLANDDAAAEQAEDAALDAAARPTRPKAALAALPWGRQHKPSAQRLPSFGADLLDGLVMLTDETPPTKGTRSVSQDDLLALYQRMEVGTSFKLEWSAGSFKKAATSFAKQGLGRITIGKDSGGQLRVWRVA